MAGRLGILRATPTIVLRAAGLLCCSWALGMPQAHAGCVGPSSALLWSYPLNGSLNVPTNSLLLAQGDVLGIPALDASRLQPLARGVYPLGELKPQTTYEVRWDVATIRFVTGDGPQTYPATRSQDFTITRNPVGANYCPLVPDQGCFDTGPPTRVRFDAGAAVAWSVEVLNCDGSSQQLLWPGSCGAPTIDSEDPIVCANLRPTDGVSLGEPLGLRCSAPRLSAGVTPARSSGCVGAWPPEGALTVIADNGTPIYNGSSTGAPSPTPTPAPVPDAPAAYVTPSGPSDVTTNSGCSLSPGPLEPISRAGLGALCALGILLGRRRLVLRLNF